MNLRTRGGGGPKFRKFCGRPLCMVPNEHLVNYLKSFFPPDATNSIERAVKSDEGNYTCEPANLDAPSVRLHVVSGKQRSGDTGLKGGNGREDSASLARD